jgi:hypothetical protein
MSKRCVDAVLRPKKNHSGNLFYEKDRHGVRRISVRRWIVVARISASYFRILHFRLALDYDAFGTICSSCRQCSSQKRKTPYVQNFLISLATEAVKGKGPYIEYRPKRRGNPSSSEFRKSTSIQSHRITWQMSLSLQFRRSKEICTTSLMIPVSHW